MVATEATPVPHVAIFPSPGFGHLAPAIELGRLLVSLHSLRATVFVVATEIAAAQSRRALPVAGPDGLRLVELPRSDMSTTVAPNAPMWTRMTFTMTASLPALRSALREASPAPSVLVVDIFGTDAFDVAEELGMSKYLFFTSTAAFLALTVHAPALDRDVEDESAGLPGPVRVPGCRPIRIDDLSDSMQLKREDEGYQWFLHHCRRFPMARGILVNTCEEIEPEPLAALRDDPAFAEIPTPRLYPVGPVIRTVAEHPEPAHACLQWLDLQPPSSVLFVSFGSGGALSAEQTAELAWGLQYSEQRFLWVTRRPTRSSASTTYFTSGGGSPGDGFAYLPEGFLQRTEGRGFLVASWAPQVEILRHPAVGGFLTHGGWNSALESLAHGVAMIVWPLYAEQRMNAAKLEGELRVAVRVRAEGGLVRREEVERVARLLMEGVEGKAMKGKAAELRDCFTTASSEGGSSRHALAEVVGDWKLGTVDV